MGIGRRLKKGLKKYGSIAFGAVPGGLFGGPGRPPGAPDPNAVAEQQIGYGQRVQGLNAPDQTGLFASTQYQRDPKTGGITGAKTALTPEMQAIYDQLRGGIGTRPGDVSNALYGQYTSRLDPRFNEQESALNARLANMGLTPGSEAYNREKELFGRERTDAYGEAQRASTLAGGQEQSRLLQGLFGLGSASGAGYQNIPQIATPNIGDYVYKGYQGQQDAYNQRVGSQNAMMGGLFDLGAAAAPALIAASDRRLKSSIVRVGTHRLGIGVYEYDIGGRRERGVMAQEVLGVMPAAVVTMPNGYLAVNYGALNG